MKNFFDQFTISFNGLSDLCPKMKVSHSLVSPHNNIQQNFANCYGYLCLIVIVYGSLSFFIVNMIFFFV